MNTGIRLLLGRTVVTALAILSCHAMNDEHIQKVPFHLKSANGQQVWSRRSVRKLTRNRITKTMGQQSHSDTQHTLLNFQCVRPMSHCCSPVSGKRSDGKYPPDRTADNPVSSPTLTCIHRLIDGHRTQSTSIVEERNYCANIK